MPLSSNRWNWSVPTWKTKLFTAMDDLDKIKEDRQKYSDSEFELRAGVDSR